MTPEKGSASVGAEAAFETNGKDEEMMAPPATASNPLLSAALEYAARGFPVFPCKPRSKEPATPHGFKDATTDPAKIRAFWKTEPLANVAIATGAASVFVLDVDGLEGEASLAALLSKNGPLPRTTEVQTGRGRQLHFAGCGLPSSAGKLGPGLDTRGRGGYVVAPPSIHPNGTRYAFTYQDGLAKAPAWLAASFAKPEPPPRPAPVAVKPSSGRSTPYGRKALDGLTDEVARATEGTRNHTLNRAAHRAGKLVAGGEVDEGEARAALVAAGRAAGLEEEEIAKTVASGLDAGKVEPVSAPPRPAPLVLVPRGAPLAAVAPVVSIERDEDPPLLLDLPSALALNAPRDPVPTGIVPLDAALRQPDDPRGGIGTGEAVVIAGGPGAFKTTLVASIVEKLATPATAVLFIAADEPSPRVARKIGARYGEAWKELCSDYPSALERLREKLVTRGAFIRVTHPNARYTLEDALDAFASVIPEGRRVYVILDHLHSVTTRDAQDDDTEKVQIERAVTAVLSYVRRLEWSIVALSEVTKAALHVASAKETPLQTFAGTRKIASRFDAAFLMVPDGDQKVRVIVAKNRFGPREDFTLEVDVERWSIREVTDEEREEVSRVTVQAKLDDDERAVLRIIDAAPDRAVGVGRSRVKETAGIQGTRAVRAIDLLIEAGTIEEIPGPPGKGKRPTNLRRVIS